MQKPWYQRIFILVAKLFAITMLTSWIRLDLPTIGGLDVLPILLLWGALELAYWLGRVAAVEPEARRGTSAERGAPAPLRAAHSESDADDEGDEEDEEDGYEGELLEAKYSEARARFDEQDGREEVTDTDVSCPGCLEYLNEIEGYVRASDAPHPRVRKGRLTHAVVEGEIVACEKVPGLKLDPALGRRFVVSYEPAHGDEPEPELDCPDCSEYLAAIEGYFSGSDAPYHMVREGDLTHSIVRGVLACKKMPEWRPAPKAAKQGARR